MTLLTICQTVASEAGFAVPASIVGNSDDTASLLFSMANRSGKVLAGRSWSILQKEYAFSQVAAQAAYNFPADLGRFLDYTFWDRTNFWNLRGSLNPQEWQRYKSGIQSTTPRQRFRVKLGQIYIDPTPTAADSLVIEYLSDYWVAVTAAPTVGAKSAFSLDTDVSLIDEDAIAMDTLWRFLNRKGLAYAEEKDQADRFIDELFANDTPKGPIYLGGDDMYPWPPLPSVPVTGYS